MLVKWWIINFKNEIGKRELLTGLMLCVRFTCLRLTYERCVKAFGINTEVGDLMMIWAC